MRFGTSQATPSYLDRRLQLRMLSFVGLISLIMITLGVMNRRPGTGADVAKSPATASPDSLAYEVQRDRPVLKPDEVIIMPAVADCEPRGQLAQHSRSDTQADLAAEDKDLFKSRSQERTRSDRFFSRRSIPSARNDEERSSVEIDDERPVKVQPQTDDFALEDVRSNDSPPASRPQKAPSRPAPPIDDDWIPTVESKNAGKADVEPIGPPPREPPIFDDEIPKVGPLTDDVEKPFRSNSSRDDSFGLPRDKRKDDVIRRRIDDGIGESAPTRHQGKSRPSRVDQDEPPSIERDPFVSSGNRPPRGDRRRERAVESAPFREDYTSARIDRRYLDQVKDNTLGIRNDESEVFYWLVDHARRVSSTSLDRAGSSEVTYVNLMTEPDRYRGEPITIEGDLWRLYEVDAGPNDYGVQRIYEGWVFTGDSGNHPYRIVCTGLPKGIQPAESLRKPVRITGYFFKREGYRSNGGVHVAPTLIAHRIEMNPMPNGIPLASGIVPYMTGAVMALALALLVTIVGFAISDERSSRGSLQKLLGTPHASFAHVQLAPQISVEQALRELAERERESTVSGAYGPLLTRQAAREHAVHDNGASRQLQMDNQRHQAMQQTAAVHDWALWQQVSQLEIDALRRQKYVESASKVAAVDELSSDRLDPARQTVARFDFVDHSKQAPVPVPDPVAANATIQVPAPILPPPLPPVAPVPAEPLVARTPAMPSPQPPANHAYSASKLSEWESEVERLNSRNQSDFYGTTFTLAPAAANRAERERLERERIAREHHEHELLEQERSSDDRDHRAAS